MTAEYTATYLKPEGLWEVRDSASGRQYTAALGPYGWHIADDSLHVVPASDSTHGEIVAAIGEAIRKQAESRPG